MKKLIAYLSTTAAALTLVTSAKAVEIQVYTEPDPLQDDWVLDGLVHEIGTVNFPPNELILAYDVTWAGHIPCPYGYLGGGAAQVQIQNLTGRDWYGVYYVGDPETNLSNEDEWVGQIGFMTSKAFKIDSIGENTPLVFESMAPDNVFQNNEIWEFVIQDYFHGLGAPASALDSVGIAWASLGFPPSSGSIIAVVPEPSSMALMLLGALALLWRRRS